MCGITTGSDGRLMLPAVFASPQAGPLKTEIERSLAGGVGMTIDASQVQRVSSLCLQVLAAGVRAFGAAGGAALTIVNPSPAFLETASVLGMKSALGLT